MMNKQKSQSHFFDRLATSLDGYFNDQTRRSGVQNYSGVIPAAQRQVMDKMLARWRTGTPLDITPAQAEAAGFSPRIASGVRGLRVVVGSSEADTADRPSTRTATPGSLAEHERRKAEIADAMKTLNEPRPNTTLANGVTKAIAPDLFDWRIQDDHGWDTAIHEAAHAVVALKVGAGIQYAIVDHGGRSGHCMVTQLANISPQMHAAIDFSGAHAAGQFMQSNDGTGDRDHYDQRKAESGNAENFDDDAMSRARTIVDVYRPAIVAVARLLYSHMGRRVDGDSIAFIVDYFDGKAPELTEAIEYQRSMKLMGFA